jgi:mono/diheme cytochrome c family protein
MKGFVVFGVAAVLTAGLFVLPAQAQSVSQHEAAIARGRYLVAITGCNDCHTAGFTEANSKLPERDWLKGSTLGFRGPWGTTYPTNLRNLVAHMTEADWLAYLRTMHPKPPMPWWSVKGMTPDDQRALYAFIRHLGPAGENAPDDLPPGIAPPPPVVSFPAPPAEAAVQKKPG